MDPRMRSTWGTAELVMALAAGGWAYAISRGEPAVELFWPMLTAVAAVFFAVASVLFYRNHPDGVIVGVFGLMFFVAAMGILAIVDDDVRQNGTRLLAVLASLVVVGAAQGLILAGAARKARPKPADAGHEHA